MRRESSREHKYTRRHDNGKLALTFDNVHYARRVKRLCPRGPSFFCGGSVNSTNKGFFKLIEKSGEALGKCKYLKNGRCSLVPPPWIDVGEEEKDDG